MRRATRDLAADETIRHVLEATELPWLSAASFEGPQRVANLAKLLRMASELGRDGRLSLTEIVDALERERPSEKEPDSPLADDEADAVRIMTVHKVKGLENERVILADVARGDRAGDDRGPVRVAHRLDRTHLALRLGSRRNADRAWLDEENRLHERAEELRVLYVALTRARRRLALLVGHSDRSSSWLDALRGWGYDAAAPPPDGAPLDGGRVTHRMVVPADVTAPPAAAAPRDPQDSGAAHRAAVAAVVAAAGRPLLARPSAAAEPARAAAGHPEPEADRGLARAAGIVVHAALARGDPRNPPSALDFVEPLARAAARETGADPVATAREAGEILGAFARSPLAARLAAARVLGREVPMLLHENGTTWAGTLDLLLEEAGRILVVDFKTDRDLDRSAAAARHGVQVTIYARAVRRALRLSGPVAAEVWLLRAGSAVPIAESAGLAETT
jgi:ATP-dependent helicase/nuclease subunit A